MSANLLAVLAQSFKNAAWILDAALRINKPSCFYALQTKRASNAKSLIIISDIEACSLLLSCLRQDLLSAWLLINRAGIDLLKELADAQLRDDALSARQRSSCDQEQVMISLELGEHA